MSDQTEPVDLQGLIKQSRRRANRLFWAVVVLLALFFLSLLTALPQWIDSARSRELGVKSAAEAERQAQLWQKNYSCTTEPSHWVTAPNKIKVDAVVCPSGDIFIRMTAPDGSSYFKWVPVDDVISKRGQGALIPAAQE